MEYREEKDTMGVVKVPKDKLWGAQTERSLENFRVGQEKIPLEIIYALAYVKKAAAQVNHSLDKLDKKLSSLIEEGADAIIDKKLDAQFPLVVWQTGSGTQTNMNVNEVISNFANQSVGEPLGTKNPIHPNDHVNMGQSSNDVIPTAITVAVCQKLDKFLLPKLEIFYQALAKKREEFDSITKCGRTHLMDATPLTLGQEFSGYEAQIKSLIEDIKYVLTQANKLALGGTTVGTGLNSHPKFAKKVAQKISSLTGISFETAPNKFQALGSMDDLALVSSVLRRGAVAFMKIANDIRLMASGPRCGIGELQLPSNEPGSSIMPGKVNPTQCEMMTQVAAQVIGNDVTVSTACANGHFELNVFRPVAAYNILQSIQLLGDSARNFTEKCLVNIQANEKKIQEHLENSLMLVTALNPHIGYDKAAQIAKKAHETGSTLKEAAVLSGFVSEDEFNSWVNPLDMVHPKH